MQYQDEAGRSSRRPIRFGRPLGKGWLRGDLFTPEAGMAWNLYRRIGGLGTMVICLVMAAWWSWLGGVAVGAIAGLVFVDAELRRREKTRRSLVQSVVVDVTLIGLAITLIDLEPAGIGAPYVYMMSVVLLLLPPSRAFSIAAYASVWGLLALLTDAVFASPSGVTRSVVTGFSYAIFTVLLLAMIAVLARSLGMSRRFADQRLKGEVALVVAGQELLSKVDESALPEVLEAIREATGAQAAFIAENSGDPQSGPAAVVSQVSADPDTITNSTSMRWKLPYMQHREAAAALAKGEPVRLDEALGLVLGRQPGSVAALAVPIFVQGEWSGFLGIAHDSEIGSISEPDLHVLETIAAMIGSFIERRNAYERLEQLVESKDQFLASISHEIRTPLTSVLGFASVLREDPSHLSAEDGQELVELIQHQAQEVSDLVEDLLVAARADIDAVTVTKQPVCLAREIESVLSSRLAAEEKELFVAASQEHVAVADPTRVRQIIRNLLTNSLRYGGDQITITTHRDGPRVIMVFSDNGKGIPNEFRRQIFDPYYRGDSSTAQPQSIGLGLAVSRQLARLMDGDLSLRPDLGPATFQLTLPMAPKSGSEDNEGETVMVGTEGRSNTTSTD